MFYEIKITQNGSYHWSQMEHACANVVGHRGGDPLGLTRDYIPLKPDITPGQNNEQEQNVINKIVNIS